MRSVTIWVLCGLAVVAVLSGAIGQYFYPGEIMPLTDILFTVVATALLFIWYRADSDRLAYRRSIGLNVAVVFVSAIAMPYYFFRSRGFKYGSFATALFLIVAIVYWLLIVVGQYAAYYGLQS